GADAALNLDGGGSTTMVVRPKGGGSLKVANKLQDGAERGVSGILMAADTEPERIFSDVSYRNDHFEGINWLKENGIQGYPNGTYGVYDQLTREQAAVMFTNTMGLEKTDPSVAAELFDDIDVSKTYAEFIGAVAQEGIYKGEDGKFLPYDKMTRQQMATTIVNAFGLEETDNHVDVNLENVSESHQKNVQILADYGITKALDDFRAYEAVTRGQFATFLHKASQVQ
ncbi:MAG TPA: S-layer homology domain-containing protein, partial [Virgibacillus sp.]